MISPISLLLVAAFWLALAGASLFALAKGAWPERIGALAMIAASGLSVLVKPGTLKAYLHFEAGTFVVDLVLLAILIGLALRTPRNWPIWAAGFQLAGLSSHIAVLVTPHYLAVAYSLLQGFWAYPILASLAAGAAGHWRRNHDSRNAGVSGKGVGADR